MLCPRPREPGSGLSTVTPSARTRPASVEIPALRDPEQGTQGRGAQSRLLSPEVRVEVVVLLRGPGVLTVGSAFGRAGRGVGGPDGDSAPWAVSPRGPGALGAAEPRTPREGGSAVLQQVYSAPAPRLSVLEVVRNF